MELTAALLKKRKAYMKKLNNVFNLEHLDAETAVFRRKDGLSIYLHALEDKIIRMLVVPKDGLQMQRTWTIAPGMSDVPWEGRDRLDLTPFKRPHWNRIINNNDEIVLQTSFLRLEIDPYGFFVNWLIRKGENWELMAADRPTLAYHFQMSNKKQRIAHFMKRFSDEAYYGLGEKSGPLDRHGRRFRMGHTDALGYNAEKSDPLYKSIPFYIVHRKNEYLFYGLFYDITASCTIDLGKEINGYHGPYRSITSENGDHDMYFIAGPSLKEVVRQWTWLTGKPALPPKWALGYSASSMAYTEHETPLKEIKTFLTKAKEHTIEVSSYHVSSGYYRQPDGRRHIFRWDESRFPDPHAWIDTLKQNGTKVITNIKPFVLDDHPFLPDLQNNNMLIRTSSNTPAMSVLWGGMGAFLDFSNPETIFWWKEMVKTTLLAHGVDGLWNDNNEFNLSDEDAFIFGFGQKTSFDKFYLLMPNLMAKASYEAMKEAFYENNRPFLVSRSGTAGLARYAQTWTGDNFTAWETIRFNQYMALGLSLSGISNIGHDIGGFYGPRPDGELFLRWLEANFLYPRFTVHSWKEDGKATEFWDYPAFLKQIHEILNLRTFFLPYLYHLMLDYHLLYHPVLRPVFYNIPDDPMVYFHNKDDLMIGADLLLAPVLEPEVRERNIYLPKTSSGWWDWHAQKWISGGQHITVPAPLGKPPLFIKNGTLIPFIPSNSHNKSHSRSGLNWQLQHILILAPENVFEVKKILYDDDGSSMDFERGKRLEIHVHLKSMPDHITIDIVRNGSYEPPEKELNFYLPASDQRLLSIISEGNLLTQGYGKQTVHLSLIAKKK